MIRPSYNDLMKVINSNVEEGEEPLVNSRYSIVVATAKRARQIISGSKPLVTPKCNRPLSIAVQEVYEGKVKILPNDPEEAEKTEAPEETNLIAEDTIAEAADPADEM